MHLRAALLSLTIISLYLCQVPDPTKWRSYDGYGNNIANPTWGQSNTELKRMGPAHYGDGISSSRLSVLGGPLPNPRLISNTVHPPPPNGKQPLTIRALTDFTTYWGQFMDHDLSLTGGPKGSAVPLEPIDIAVPKGDAYFDPNNYGNQSFTIYRSVFDNNTGNNVSNPRQQINLVTSFMDGSQVYGYDNVSAAHLRNFTGGLLLTTIGPDGLEYPPLNTNNYTNANDPHVVPDNQLYLLGDVRGNENPALTSLHTIFIREHNRRARQLAARNSSWTDEELYQEARRWVIALLQHITFQEYFPITIGDAAPPYTGYNASVNPSIVTEFSTGAFRYGHSEVADKIWRVDATGAEIPQGHLSLKASYFNSPTTIAAVGIDPILRGMNQFVQNQVDIYFVDDLRNYLFGNPGTGGLDLAAVNIQRGRDHGIPSYNDLRALYGLTPYTNFSQVHPDPAVWTLLNQAYNGTIDDCDIYVCGLAEFHDYANVGDTFVAVIMDQYLRFRDGDRFWYENNQWGQADMAEIMNTTLKDVIVRNTKINASELPCFVFAAADGCGKTIVTPAPGPLYTTYDFTITLGKKTPAHPLYGKGHEYGLLVNGVEGANITVVRGKNYTFHSLISCAHSFTINPQPEDGIVPIAPIDPNYPGGDYDKLIPTFGCINWNKEQLLTVPKDLVGALYYSCDFHPLMGGNIIVNDPPVTTTGSGSGSSSTGSSSTSSTGSSSTSSTGSSSSSTKANTTSSTSATSPTKAGAGHIQVLFSLLFFLVLLF